MLAYWPPVRIKARPWLPSPEGIQGRLAQHKLFACTVAAKLCFELGMVNGTPWVDDMARAGLIRKYHCELLRKDTN